MVSSAEGPNPGGGLDAASSRFDCTIVGPGRREATTREVIAEQPLRIVIDGKPAATLMRTPGGELELVVGFLLTEGIVRSRAEIGAVTFCRDGSLGEPGEVLVRLVDGGGIGAARRYRDVLSSCSLCGDEWIEKIAEGVAPFDAAQLKVRASDVFRLSAAMSAIQRSFKQTGAAHAAALSETPVSATGEGVIVREDLGRHNALDKAVGAAVGTGVGLDRALLFLSSRLSFEMVVKAARARIGRVAGVSAPSGAAVELARRLRMFLAGFVRGETMTVYTGVEALDLSGKEDQ